MKERVPAARLAAWAAEIMRAHGVDEPQVASVTAHLIWSELVGRGNFGLQRLPILLERVERGAIACPCKTNFTALSPSMQLLDAGGGFGHHAGELAMSRAIDLALDHGIGAVGVRNSNFFGAGGYFVQLAAEAGMIGIAMSNSFPKVAAHGGLAPVLGTNPFAFGAPRRNGRSLLVDMATSALAGSTVREHIEKKRPLPEGLAIDAQGAPITDPKRVDDGALLPFAGPKGFGLSLMVELLSGILTGAGVSHGVGSMYKDLDRPADNGHFFLALDISRWMAIDAYNARSDALIDILKTSNPAGEVLLPGEIRWRNYDDNLANGIALEPATLAALRRFSSKPLFGEMPALPR